MCNCHNFIVLNRIHKSYTQQYKKAGLSGIILLNSLPSFYHDFGTFNRRLMQWFPIVICIPSLLVLKERGKGRRKEEQGKEKRLNDWKENFLILSMRKSTMPTSLGTSWRYEANKTRFRKREVVYQLTDGPL